MKCDAEYAATTADTWIGDLLAAAGRSGAILVATSAGRAAVRLRGQHLRRSDQRSAPAADVQRSRTGAIRAGAIGTEASSILDLQRKAGNQAVAAEIGAWRNGRKVVGVADAGVTLHPSAPPDGVRQIREGRGGGGLLGRTIASIDPSAPLLRAEAPVKTDGGWTARAAGVRVPEPYLEEFWPTAGRHEQYPHVFLDVSRDWEQQLHAGEDEHAADHTTAWQATWGVVGEAINRLAKAPGKPQPTEDAARADLWTRFVGCLPADLRPKGSEPTDEAQNAAWGFDPKTTLFRRLFDATRVRDTRGWHTTGSELDHMDGSDEIRTVSANTSQIGTVSSADLIAELRGGAGAAP